MNQNISPEKLFDDFLSSLQKKGWITKWTWTSGNTNEEMRARLGGPCPKGSSRTHKNAPKGAIHALQVTAPDGLKTGIDLEWFDEEAQATVLRKLARRFGFPSGTKPLAAMEEWCRREAAYKAYCNHDRIPGIHIGNIMSMAKFEFKLTRAENWLLCFAKVLASTPRE